MKRIRLAGKWAGLGFCGWLAGCATVPMAVPQSLLQARQSLLAAGSAQADTLAPDDFLIAQRQLKEAESAWAGEKPMDVIERLAFEAQAFAEIAKAGALRLQAEQNYSALEESLAREQAFAQQSSGVSNTQTPAAMRIASKPAPPAPAAVDRKQDEILLGQARKIKHAETAMTSRGLILILPSRQIFASSSSQLQDTAHQVLDQVAALLKQNPGYHAIIEGHTDNMGDTLTNNTLSQAQAESVLNDLQQRGVAFDNLQAVGRGGSRPIASNDQPLGRQRNCRLEFILEKRTENATQP